MLSFLLFCLPFFFFFAMQTANRNGCECLSVCYYYLVLLDRLKKNGGGEGVEGRGSQIEGEYNGNRYFQVPLGKIGGRGEGEGGGRRTEQSRTVSLDELQCLFVFPQVTPYSGVQNTYFALLQNRQPDRACHCPLSSGDRYAG